MPIGMPPPRLYVWPPLSPAVYAHRTRQTLPWPLQVPGARLFSRARHGLWHGLRALGIGRGDQVLLPAYNNGAEVEAIESAGASCVFYDITEDLRPDEGHVESLLPADVKALYIIHYFGFPQDVARWRKWCDERGLLLIEDAAMAWLSSAGDRPVGSVGDLAIFCLYKSVGLPDGGCVVSSVPLPYPEARPDAGLQMLAIRHASWLAQRVPPVAVLHSMLNGLSPRVSRLGFAPGHEFALGNPDSPPCRTTLALVPRVADEVIAVQRRANYRRLAAELDGKVRPVAPELPAGASPIAFPIWASPQQQDRLIAALQQLGVFGTRLWPNLHPSVPKEGVEFAAYARENIFVLPLHQELRPKDLDRIVRGVDAAAIEACA